jgi:riboflavin synthase
LFTGIVEAVGRVASTEPRGEKIRLAVEAPGIAAEATLGQSIAVNGACLTVVETTGGRVVFEAVRETLDRTALGGLGPGARVNLERALRADGRLDGHIVQGHVDGVGVVRRLDRHGDDVRLVVGCEPALAKLLVPKGSVTVDGVSLTVVGVEEGGFDVALIPHTLAATNLDDRRPGDRVNLEADVLGKYVLRYLEGVLGGGAALRR